MVKFGTKTLPLVLQIEERNRKIYVERPIPGKSIPHRKVHGAFGEEYVVRGLITSNLIAEKADLKTLADGTSRVLDLEDGSAQLCAIMVDPVFHRPEKQGQIPYELLFAQTSLFQSGSLSDSPVILDVLSGLPIGIRSLSDSPSISETLKHYKRGPNFGFSTIGSQNYPTYEHGETSYTGITPMDSTTINTWCTKISVPAPCTVKQIHIYLDSVVGNKRVSIFDNASPGNRLGQSAAFLGAAGAWNAIDLLSRAHIPSSGTYWAVVTEISGNAEKYGYNTGASGDGKATATSYVSDPGFPSTLDIAGMTSYTSKLAEHIYAIRIKGYAKRAVKFNLASQTPVEAVRLYSHVAVGNTRAAIFDEASPKAKKWESGSVALAVGFNQIPISTGSPTSLTLSPGDFGLWWQYDDLADALSFTQGASGDGCYKEQAYGAFPATISGETSTNEKWTEDGIPAWIEIV